MSHREAQSREVSGSESAQWAHEGTPRRPLDLETRRELGTAALGVLGQEVIAADRPAPQPVYEQRLAPTNGLIGEDVSLSAVGQVEAFRPVVQPGVIGAVPSQPEQKTPPALHPPARGPTALPPGGMIS